MDIKEVIKDIGFPEEFAGCIVLRDKKVLERYIDYLEKKGVKFDYREGINEFKYKNKKFYLPYDNTIFIEFPENFKEEYPIEIIFLAEILQRVNIIIKINKNSKITFYSGCIGTQNAKHRDKTIIIMEDSELNNIKLHSWFDAKYDNPNVTFDGIYILNNSKMRNFFFTYNFNDYYVSKIKVYMNNSLFEDYLFTHQINGKFISSIKVYAKNNSKVKLISRNVTLDGITVTKNYVFSLGKNNKSYSSCDGLILGKGKIFSIPGVYSKKDNYLFHEASIGKIEEEVLEYLMSRGLDEEEAKNLYILGFLSSNLPEFLGENIKLLIKSYIMQNA